MGDVKRYDPARYVEMREAPGGPYVKYSDYAALLARHNALVEAVKTLRTIERALPDFYMTPGKNTVLFEARSEVDRLIARGEGDG